MIKTNRPMVLHIIMAAVCFSAFGAEPVKVELEEGNSVVVNKASEAKPQASPVEIAQRCTLNGAGWLFSERDREVIAITVTNQDGRVYIGPTAFRITRNGLAVQTADKEILGVWCDWQRLPVEIREKYQAVVIEAQKLKPVPSSTPVVYTPVATSPASTAVSAPAPVYSSPASSSDKTVHVRGYTRKDGTYVAPYDRRAPRK